MSLPALRTLTEQANREHALFVESARSMVAHAIACGEALTEMKQLVGHGGWLPWIQEHFAASESTARRYMRLAANQSRVTDLEEPSLRKALAAVSENGLAVHQSSATGEWNTPAPIVDAVVRALGDIDLDPCADDGENPNVPASQIFTEDDDGLSKPWHGRVYMNPPYGKTIGEWVRHLVAEYEAGRVKEAIALVPARTDTEWWRVINAYPWCGIYGRLRFGDADAGAPFPSAVFYLGEDPEDFARVFSEFGALYERR